MCQVPLDNLVDGGYVVLFACGECGFSSFGSWSCSEEKVRGWHSLDTPPFLKGGE